MFSFKKEAKVYLVWQGYKFTLDISEISFSQTFNEISYSSKTLQEQNMFRQSALYQASPVFWNFTLPVLAEEDLNVVFDRMADCLAFDLYIEVNGRIYFIDKCVITSGVFIIVKNRVLQLQVNGEGSRLSSTSSIPGTSVPRAVSRSYARLDVLEVALGGVSLPDAFTEMTFQVRNGIQWITNINVKDSLKTINADSNVYPEKYVVNSREISGTITGYQINGPDKAEDTTLRIRAGGLKSSLFHGLLFDAKNVSFTNRTGTGQIFTESYDWRMTQNPRTLEQVLQIINITTGPLDSILDDQNIPILDFMNQTLQGTV